MVAPLVGAWIEMPVSQIRPDPVCVAPLVGAWIEIYDSAAQPIPELRRSPRGSVD